MSQETKMITGVVRFSYCHLFEPDSINGSDPKYSLSIIIDKDDKTTLDKVEKAIQAATELGKTSKFEGKIPKNLDTPLRDGDIDREEDVAYADKYFINAKSKNKPGIIDKDRREIVDPMDVYSGCYGKVQINFYPYNVNGKKGIACALENVLKLREGEPLGVAREDAVDAFADDFEEDDLA